MSQSRLFYYFLTLFIFSAAEPKQVIRALRIKSSLQTKETQKPFQSTLERSMIAKSSAWKLPPNVYIMKDHFQKVSKTQMGKLGPYRCFTVERDVKTVKNNLAPKPLQDNCDIFYEMRSGNMEEEMTLTSNRYKSRFLKAERFVKPQLRLVPPPTKYYPQNFTMKPKFAIEAELKKPLFYYPQTSVPVTEMLFNKTLFSTPAPGRYDLFDAVCQKYSNLKAAKCDVDERQYTTKDYGIVDPTTNEVKTFKLQKDEKESEIVGVFSNRRELLSFRTKRPMSAGDLIQKEIRFNTMVKKKNLFSVKTGRPVAFLTASPRFREVSDISIELDKERDKSKIMMKEADGKPRRKPITVQRLEELATPRNPLPKVVSDKVNIHVPLSLATSQKIIKKVIVTGAPLKMYEISLDEIDENEDIESDSRTLSKSINSLGTQSVET